MGNSRKVWNHSSLLLPKSSTCTQESAPQMMAQMAMAMIITSCGVGCVPPWGRPDQRNDPGPIPDAILPWSVALARFVESGNISIILKITIKTRCLATPPTSSRAMAQARVDNSADRTFRSFLSPELLILDDLGCNRLTPSHSLFTRYNTSPALVRWTTSLSGLWAAFPHGAVYVMTLWRTNAGINKKTPGGWTPKSCPPMRRSDSFRRGWPVISNFVAGSASRPCATEVQ